MMTQSDLLELAQRGNPQAIASLMNLVLEPKGVVAKATLKDSCLQIFFASEQLLSQQTIVNFVKNGLSNLKANSIQRVKVFAQKQGQELPVWTDEFQLASSASAMRQSVRQTPMVAPKSSALEPDLPTLSSINLPSATFPLKQISHTKLTKISPHLQGSRRVPKQPKRNLGFYTRRLVYRVRTSNRYGLAVAIAIGAFMVGGSLSLIAHFQSKGNSQQASNYGLSPDGSLNNQILVQASGDNSTDGQQTNAKTYLSQMNRAQQSFYQSNNRFAANLEELERSAAIVSRSSGYTYKLVIRDETQSVLTAVPKTDNLKSYAATVLSAQSPQSAGAITTIICETTHPSTFPPVLPQTSSQMVQCPADSIQVVN